MRLSLIRDVKEKRRMWSGTVHYMAQNLAQAGLVVEDTPPVMPNMTILLDKTGYAMRRVGMPRIMINRSRTMSRIKGRILDQRLAADGADAVFAPVSATLIPDLKTDKPIIYVSDATLLLMYDYYSNFADWSARSRARAVAQERASLQRADLLLFPSQWVAQSVIDDYGIDPAKILVTPFGANIDDAPPREVALAPRAPGPLQLLWCGVDWVRKGGDVTLSAFDHLRKGGIDAKLTILGAAPETDIPAHLADHVTVVPFLRKSDPAQYRRFQDIYLSTDILVLPTQAECYGVVFCEAAAYGMPSITTATGGTSAVVVDGETGLLLPTDLDGPFLAQKLAELAEDPARLERMRVAARDDYETRLNWTTWAETVVPAITALKS